MSKTEKEPGSRDTSVEPSIKSAWNTEPQPQVVSVADQLERDGVEMTGERPEIRRDDGDPDPSKEVFVGGLSNDVTSGRGAFLLLPPPLCCEE